MQFTNNLKAILFDFDGTLRHNLPSGGEVFTNYVVESLGLPVTDEDRQRAARWEHYYFASSPEIQADNEKYKDEEEDFWSHFAHRRLVALGCPPQLVPEFGPRVSKHMQQAYKPESRVPDEVHTVIPELRKSGYTLGVVSNRDNPYQDEIDEMGMEGYFHFSLAAGEVNSWKPEIKIFRHAIKIAKSLPEQTLYIGDNYFADVVGARRAGLQPVLYDPKGLFYEPGCPVITSFDEITELLKQYS